MYRVIKILTDDFASKITESVYWEGPDTDELSLKYPPSGVYRADRLGDQEIEDGWIRWRFRFESLNKNNKWVECEDFRTRLNDDYSEIERQVHQENLRMFPGDYLVEEEEELPYPYWDDED